MSVKHMFECYFCCVVSRARPPASTVTYIYVVYKTVLSQYWSEHTSVFTAMTSSCLGTVSVLGIFNYESPCTVNQGWYCAEVRSWMKNLKSSRTPTPLWDAGLCPDNQTRHVTLPAVSLLELYFCHNIKCFLTDEKRYWCIVSSTENSSPI